METIIKTVLFQFITGVQGIKKDSRHKQAIKIRHNPHFRLVFVHVEDNLLVLRCEDLNLPVEMERNLSGIVVCNHISS